MCNEDMPNSESAPDIDEAAVLEQAAKDLAGYLYDRTAISKVTARKPLLRTPPEPLTKEQIESLLSGIDAGQAHAALSTIAVAKGKKDVYYYDAKIMTKQYADLDALLSDKDILATIATVTRSDSKLYPRPTQYSKLMNTPFKFSRDEILGAAARMQNDEAYKDIGVVTASNGNSAFYSELHLSRRYAQSLIQQIEVDEKENP